MKKNIDAVLIVKNIFKSNNDELRKKEFNKKYENYIKITKSSKI